MDRLQRRAAEHASPAAPVVPESPLRRRRPNEAMTADVGPATVPPMVTPPGRIERIRRSPAEQVPPVAPAPRAVRSAGSGRPDVIRRVIVSNVDVDTPIGDAELQRLRADHPTRRADIDTAMSSPDRFSYRESRSGLALNKVKVAKAKRTGAMFGRVGGHADADEALQQLAHVASLANVHDSLAASGMDTIGQYGMPVQQVAKKRQGKHRATFQRETGSSSAGEYAAQIHADLSGLDWEITHLKGYAQVGPAADVRDENLVAATTHANTEMMFFDRLVTGNRDIIVRTSAEVFGGTRVAKTIAMSFAHRAAPDRPIFTRTVYALRPRITKEEAQQLEQEAKVGITMTLEAALALLDLGRSGTDDGADGDQMDTST